MGFIHILWTSMKGMLPWLLIWTIPPLIPFIIAEQIWPVHQAPRWRDYGMNTLISLTTAYLALPLGIAAGLWSTQLRHYLPWKPFSFSLHKIGALPLAGPALEVLAMIFVPLFVHDFWFYWSHRIEHRVPVLWAFHKLHHSDELMNTSTWARDHFLQDAWRAFFSVFTLGLILDLDFTEAGKAALYSSMFLTAMSLFYHSAIRVRLPWLDRVLVTPQVHRIHHSVDPKHFDKNFADALPIFDIVFGTYHRPEKEEFPATGLGVESPAPRSIWSAQFGPLLALWNMLSSRGPNAPDTSLATAGSEASGETVK
jgi:sterol desaturase/sphingolipid hydroxylase (fatty acid hydroxylase superfamily)